MSNFQALASWYGQEFAGRPTANGEIYDPQALTAAHKSLPFGTLVLVSNPDNGASVVVRVNDRGPFVPGRDLDLSEAAATILGIRVSGTARVNCRILSPEEVAAYGLPGAGPQARGPQAKAGQAGTAASGRTCRIQVASFRDGKNAASTLERLRLSGIVATLELAGSYTRVVLLAVPGPEVEALAARLRDLGYRDLLLTWR